MFTTVCECDSGECRERVTMTREESEEAFRRDLFMVSKNCQFVNKEKIVEVRERYLLVKEDWK